MNDDELKWTEQSSKEILNTRVFSVTERHSVSYDGLEGDYIVVNARDWVIVVPVIGEDFLMVKQWRHGEKALSIEFPGGVAEKDEDFEISARRELEEETGYTAGKMTELAVFNPNPALFSNHVHVYLAEDLTPAGGQNLDEDEYVNFMRIPQKEVMARMGSSEYPHGLMLSAMALFMAHKN